MVSSFEDNTSAALLTHSLTISFYFLLYFLYFKPFSLSSYNQYDHGPLFMPSLMLKVILGNVGRQPFIYVNHDVSIQGITLGNAEGQAIWAQRENVCQ